MAEHPDQHPDNAEWMSQIEEELAILETAMAGNFQTLENLPRVEHRFDKSEYDRVLKDLEDTRDRLNHSYDRLQAKLEELRRQ